MENVSTWQTDLYADVEKDLQEGDVKNQVIFLISTTQLYFTKQKIIKNYKTNVNTFISQLLITAVQIHALEMEDVSVPALDSGVDVIVDSMDEDVKLVSIPLFAKTSHHCLANKYLQIKFISPLNNLFILDVNDCKPDSCSGNGQCFDKLNSFRCNCFPGFTGEFCEKSK